MKTITILFIGAFLIFSTSFANAQSCCSGMQGAKMDANKKESCAMMQSSNIDNLKETLGLNEEQVKRITEIQKKYTSEKKEIKTKMMQVNEMERKQISEILTEEQRTKYNEMCQPKEIDSKK